MSNFGGGIIERLPEHSVLHNPTNDMNRLLNYTVGEWLDNFFNINDGSNLFLDYATGEYLDVHGKDFNILRKEDESDDDYRYRIVQESLAHLTTTYLKEIYDLELYSFIENYSDAKMLSDNEYVTNKHIVFSNDTVKDILNKKFAIGGEIKWEIP